MNHSREVKQFKFMLLVSFIVYPFWLAYGLWNQSYNAPISVGVIYVWATWYVHHIKEKAASEASKNHEAIDWYKHSILKHINILVFAGSLFVAMLCGAGLLCLLSSFYSSL